MSFLEENNYVLTDKGFMRSFILSLFRIVLCLVCLFASTWALFSDPTLGQEDVLPSASDSLCVSLADPSGNAVELGDDGVSLSPGVVYRVTLSLPCDAPSAYCLISAGGKLYYSEHLARHSDASPHTVSFDLTVQSEQTVSLCARYGILSERCDVKGGALVIP